MLDEFPETLDNIINDEGEAQGRHFLQSNRELRHDRELCEQVQFIYTGSIGLDNLVSRLNETKTINDLARLKIPPLEPDEAMDFFKCLLVNVTFTLSDDLIKYILQKIKWLIPFYIQLVLWELKNLVRNRQLTLITQNIIDNAFVEMLDQRQHFENWHSRLRSTYKGNEYNYVKEVLNLTSESESITANDIFDLAVKYGLQDSFKDLINALVYDGYINNNEDNHLYFYNSPVLKMWWRKNVAN